MSHLLGAVVHYYIGVGWLQEGMAHQWGMQPFMQRVLINASSITYGCVCDVQFSWALRTCLTIPYVYFSSQMLAHSQLAWRHGAWPYWKSRITNRQHIVNLATLEQVGEVQIASCRPPKGSQHKLAYSHRSRQSAALYNQVTISWCAHNQHWLDEWEEPIN